jgi:site-specific DNA recombinase
MKSIAIYARVSTEQQVQQATIESQVTALKERVAADGHVLLPQDIYLDEGFSGSSLVRPALERLRDRIADGVIDRLYVHSPDRLARKYAYQVLLLDEMSKHGVTTVFLNGPTGKTAEDELLVQVQGVIAEYERAKIMERSRRGKIHLARQGALKAVLNGSSRNCLFVGA